MQDKEQREIKFEVGGMWEGSQWSIHLDERVSSYSGGEPCPHSTLLPFEPNLRDDGSVYNADEKEWTCPRVVVMKNEGGYNSTGVCLDCILEGVKTL